MNNESVFIDTGAWFAGIAKNDQYHKKAIIHMDKLLKKKCTFITSNLIVHETTMLLERKVSRKEAIKFLKVVLKDPDIEILHADEDIELEGYKTYQKYKDQDYSITDCVSFSIMNKIEITRCFTFDNHFLAMGFNVEPL